MRLRLFALLASVSVVAAAGLTMASTAGASRAPRAAVAHGKGAPSATTRINAILYTQNDSDSGGGPASQNFESSLDAYDNQAADDFTVPVGQAWLVQEVDVTGQYFNCPTPPCVGPADSENVFFYKDSHGQPGRLLKTVSAVVGTDTGGSFAIKVGKVKLAAGTYWVSVQVNMDFSTGYQWAWDSRTVQNGGPGMWQNPGGGFAVCPTWDTIQNCNGLPNDLMFALIGKSRPA